MQSPKVHGVYKGYSVALFTGEHESERGASNRQMTAIEVELESRMPISGAVASGGMVGIVQELSYSDEYLPAYDFWNSEFITRSDDKYIMAEYLTEERAKVLCKLMDNKKFWVIFIFKGNDTVLRIDTADPFDSLEKLTKTMNEMIEIAAILELKKGESGRLKTMGAKRSAEAARVEYEEDTVGSIALELEDDDGESDKASSVEQNEEKSHEPQESGKETDKETDAQGEASKSSQKKSKK
ncbi:MAG: hypothetical protein ACLFR0_05050 [Alphaproteobacteria bacterium]